jgi:hypothetical protein
VRALNHSCSGSLSNVEVTFVTSPIAPFHNQERRSVGRSIDLLKSHAAMIFSRFATATLELTYFVVSIRRVEPARPSFTQLLHVSVLFIQCHVDFH